MGDTRKDALRVDSSRSIKLEFHSPPVRSDTSFLAYCALDEAFRLTAMADEVLTGFRTGSYMRSLHCSVNRFTIAGPRTVSGRRSNGEFPPKSGQLT